MDGGVLRLSTTSYDMILVWLILILIFGGGFSGFKDEGRGRGRGRDGDGDGDEDEEEEVVHKSYIIVFCFISSRANS